MKSDSDAQVSTNTMQLDKLTEPFEPPPDLTQNVSIPLDAVQAHSLSKGDGTYRPLLKSSRLVAKHVHITRSCALPVFDEGKDRIYIIINGEAELSYGAQIRKLKKYTLIFRPAHKRGVLEVLLKKPSIDVLFLELPPDDNNAVSEVAGVWFADQAMVVETEDQPTYAPANHAKTKNRCLFFSDYIEILHGHIGAGGRAEEHFHDALEQLTYVIDPKPEQLLYTAPKVKHGGGAYQEPLDLLVIYSPPYGESRKYR